MRTGRAWAVAAAVALPLLIAGPSVAVADSPTFSVSPQAGGIGTTIFVRSITVCRLPAGVTGAPLAAVTVTQGSRVVATGRFTASATGGWHGVLLVGATARPGTATVSAFCLASTRAEGALFSYRSVSFTVGGLPATGAGPPAGLSAGLGLLMILAGALLVLAARRRPTRAAVGKSGS